MEPLEIRQYKEFVSHLCHYLGQKEKFAPISGLCKTKACNQLNHLKDPAAPSEGGQIGSLYCLDLFTQYPLFKG